MKGTELAKLRKGLPKTTSASELARRLGYTRQWISHQEGRGEDVPADLAAAYVGVIEALRLEQKGHEAEIVDVDVLAIAGVRGPSGYVGALDRAREWLRERTSIRRVAITGLDGDYLEVIAVMDALDRAGVDVSFRTAEGTRVIRSK